MQAQTLIYVGFYKSYILYSTVLLKQHCTRGVLFLVGVTMYKRSTIQAQTLGLCISRCAADELCDRLDYQVLNYGSIYFCKLSLIQR